MARNLVNFNDFVTDFEASQTEMSLDKYADFQQIAIAAKRAFRDLQLDAFNTIVSARLNVNTANYTVELPNDYVRYTKIGVLDRNCNVVSITLNPDQNIGGDILLDDDNEQLLDADGFPLKSAITDCASSNIQPNRNPSPYGYLFSNYNYNGFYGRLYGYGGGNNAFGYYRFNDEENRIDLSPNFDYEQIILEYISDQSMAANPKIPIECENAMYSGTYYYLVNRMANVNLGDKQSAYRTWLHDKRFAKARRVQPTKNEIVSSIYRTVQLAPKMTS